MTGHTIITIFSEPGRSRASREIQGYYTNSRKSSENAETNTSVEDDKLRRAIIALGHQSMDQAEHSVVHHGVRQVLGRRGFHADDEIIAVPYRIRFQPCRQIDGAVCEEQAAYGGGSKVQAVGEYGHWYGSWPKKDDD
ncbi:hypothetical protein MMC07_005368 [Pseudocyphellaria aurata]|nr:hypothetical protein [Pseudocyphellaria aurata]